MNAGRLEELRTRIQTLAVSIALDPPAARSNGFGYSNHSGCSKVAEEFQHKFSNDLLVEVRQRQNQKYHGRSHTTLQQPEATGPLLEKLQELAKSCSICKKNVEASQLNTFCLSLAGNDLRQVAMLPQWYWGSKLTC